MVIRDLAFNQDFTSLLMSTDVNHKIFNCDPFGEFYVLPAKEKEKCPTAFLRMLFSSSLTFIVPETSSGCRVVKVMNLKLNMKICELTFSLNIVDLMINRKRLVVFVEVGQIYIYDLSTIRLVKVVEVNCFARRGECAPSVIAGLSADENSLLVLPLLALNDQSDLLSCDTSNQSNSQPGTPVLRPSDSSVRNPLDSLIELTQKNSMSPLLGREGITLEDLQNDSPGWLLVYDAVNLKPRLIYKAHDSDIAKLAISGDSKCIASALTKGTIIRVCHLDPEAFSEEKIRIHHITNLRRGHNVTRVTTLSFSANAAILGCASNSDTIHFFAVDGSAPAWDGDQPDAEDDSRASDDDTGRSLEDLNENLANLLILRPAAEPEKEESGYFGALKRSARLLNNLYTKLIVRKLPYREYWGNLVWESPRRSFAYMRLPEYVPGSQSRNKHVEIGFGSTGLVMVASYNTGTLYHYRLPDTRGDREACSLLSLNALQDSGA